MIRFPTALRVLALALALAASACAGSAGTVGSLDRPFYTATAAISAGEPVGLRLVNGTDGSLHYNLCRSTLQRETRQGWERVDRQRSCPDVRFRLAPTETAAYDLATPRSLPPGRYRVVTPVAYDDRPETLTTSSFRVRAEPAASPAS